MEKNLLREEMLEKLPKTWSSATLKSERKIYNTLLENRFFANAKTVSLYWPNHYEVNIKDLIDFMQFAKMKMVMPRVVANSKIMEWKVVDSAFFTKELVNGIYQPTSEEKDFNLDDIDVVIMPAIGFTEDGYRIGSGRGYYDHSLENYKGIKIILAYEKQLVKFTPEETDNRADFVITEERIIDIDEVIKKLSDDEEFEMHSSAAKTISKEKLSQRETENIIGGKRTVSIEEIGLDTDNPDLDKIDEYNIQNERKIKFDQPEDSVTDFSNIEYNSNLTENLDEDNVQDDTLVFNDQLNSDGTIREDILPDDVVVPEVDLSSMTKAEIKAYKKEQKQLEKQAKKESKSQDDNNEDNQNEGIVPSGEHDTNEAEQLEEQSLDNNDDNPQEFNGNTNSDESNTDDLFASDTHNQEVEDELFGTQNDSQNDDDLFGSENKELVDADEKENKEADSFDDDIFGSESKESVDDDEKENKEADPFDDDIFGDSFNEGDSDDTSEFNGEDSFESNESFDDEEFEI